MTPSRFVWYELVTSDVDAAVKFYGPVLGWEGQEFPAGEGRYMIVSAAGKGVGGVMPLPDGMSHPFWLGYIGATDIDAEVARFTGAGGTVHRGPWDIPGVGRLALLGDPQGAGIAMIQGASDQPSEAFDQAKPGHGNWNELHTADPEAALKFYSGQFGWGAGDAIDMGPAGKYHIIMANDAQIGGMMRGEAGTRPTWLYYFGVTGISAAAKRINDHGGTALHEPREVPGGAFIVTAKDPQGAMFAIVGPPG